MPAQPRRIGPADATEAFALDSASGEELDRSPAPDGAWAAFPMTRLRPEQVAGALMQANNARTVDGDAHILVRLMTYGGVNDFVARHGDPGEAEFHQEGTTTITQRLLMMNGDLVRGSIKGDLANMSGRIAALAPDDPKAVEAAYLATLTRRPTPEEAAHFVARLRGTQGDERKARVADLIWALLNATEFSWGH